MVNYFSSLFYGCLHANKQEIVQYNQILPWPAFVTFVDSSDDCNYAFRGSGKIWLEHYLRSVEKLCV